MNILEKANEIVNIRSEEKERQYGSFSNGMENASKIFNAITNNKYNLSPEDMYLTMVALKLSRQAYNHKEDNLLDCVAYLGAMNNYLNEKK
jgi:hypothetical protein